jgi:SAM-dependent methyltransferase
MKYLLCPQLVSSRPEQAPANSDILIIDIPRSANEPSPNDAFDLVFNSSTMEHLDSFDRAFRELVRVAKPGGKIFVSVPYKYGPFLPFNLVSTAHPAARRPGDWRAYCRVKPGTTRGIVW